MFFAQNLESLKKIDVFAFRTHMEGGALGIPKGSEEARAPSGHTQGTTGRPRAAPGAAKYIHKLPIHRIFAAVLVISIPKEIPEGDPRPTNSSKMALPSQPCSKRGITS